MVFLFSTEGSETGGGRQRVLVLLLLLIVAGFCYLYFFTNMIVSHEKPAPPPPPAPVKQPIPPRPEQAAPPKEAAAPAAPPAAPAVPFAPAAPAKPAEKQTPAAAAAPSVAAPAKPAQPAAKAEAAKPAQPPAKTAATVVKVEAGKAGQPATKPVASAAQGAKPAPAAKPEAEQKGAAKEPAKPAAKGNYVLVLGEYPMDESLQKVRARLKQQGIKPVQEKQVKAVRKMNRLFIAEFADRASADAERAKLGKLTPDSFIMREEGAYRLYAGSYMVDKRAAGEKQRLAQKGVAVSVQKIELPIATIRVTAGKFTSKSEADAAAAKLRKAGVSAKVAASKMQK